MTSRVKGLPEPLPTFINQEMDRIYGGKNKTELNAEYLSAHSHSLPRVLAGCQMLNYLKPQEQNRAVQLVTALPKDMRDVNIETCGNILDVLKDGSLGKVDPQIISEFRDKCHERFPYATRFRDGDEIPHIESLKIENAGEC
jgi:peptide alpha-N-acetyltransferase